MSDSAAKRIIKPKTRRVKRALDERAPKLVENPKSSLFVRGGHTSEVITQCLRELSMLRKPNTLNLRRKNPVHPFEDVTFFETFSKKYDASLFAFGNHSKKRPNNLTLGRTFDFQLLDMVELGVDKFKSMKQFKTEKCAEGSKPCLFFAGEAFEQSSDLKLVKTLLIDFFRGPVVDNINLSGIDHVIAFVALSEKEIAFRHYRILLKKSGTRLPRVELQEIGPSMNLQLRRTQFGSDDLRKEALKKPKELKVAKVKNIEYDDLGNKLGRIHVQQQDLAELQLRKLKGLKRGHAEVDQDDDDGDDDDNDNDDDDDDDDNEDEDVDGNDSGTKRGGESRQRVSLNSNGFVVRASKKPRLEKEGRAAPSRNGLPEASSASAQKRARLSARQALKLAKKGGKKRN